MKSVLAALLLLSIPAALQAEPLPPLSLEAPATPLFDGVRYEKRVRGGDEPMVAHIVTLNLTRAGLHFEVTPGDRSKGMEHVALTASEYQRRSGAQIVINASYFLPFAGGSKGADDYYPKSGDPVNVSGAALSHGQRVSPVETDLDIRVNSIVCFKAAQVLIREGQVCPAGQTDAVAAGPRLLSDRHVQSFLAFDNNYAMTRAPRTAIGVSADGHTAWLVVVDGRQKGYSEGATLTELTDLFVALGAADAINLDGGGSSTLVREGANHKPDVLNRPIHTGIPGRERPVANHIAVYALPLK
ncbi:phosphodiester glycosidase family protein [Asticcacaulis sp. DW145]|uniref:Phosphodiester glycosidase family protein n=1 Tax=Asticcacaulis currens TaxID=2984210 RepID=A0ABT5IBW5_9CAUL|nr:phosphodiester glycosidase family protein [Asticcacaulis currens]MDC7693679.1 phosphodiester glycosidase family protein [Asticcacaulis currens]BEV10351.1 phosphodiester glycosidase family protein [Asticcacaulis sp. DW145]